MKRRDPIPATTSTGPQRAAVVGTPTNGDDVIDGGFLLESVNGLGGVDFLKLDYSGTAADGRSAYFVVLKYEPSGNDLAAFFRDPVTGNLTNEQFNIEGIERFDVTGSAGDDRLDGLDADDVLRGGGGADQLNGRGGKDAFDGGDGDDTIEQFTNGETVSGGSGYDTISILDFSNGAVSASIRLGSGVNLSLADGTRLVDVEKIAAIHLGNQTDVLDGGFALSNVVDPGGVDLLKLDYSGTAADGRSANFVVLKYEPSGNDLAAFFRDPVTGNLTNEQFNIEGIERFDVTGSAGDDRLDGLDADDVLRGGGGADQLTGQRGYDTYVFGPDWGIDTINDPDAAGKIVFDGIAESALTLSNVGGNLVITDGTNRVTFNNYYASGYAYDLEYPGSPPPPANQPPVLAPTGSVRTIEVGQTVPFSLLHATTFYDPDGDAVTRFGLYDAIPGKGYITVDGQPIPSTGQVVDASVWSSGAVQYVAGTEPGTNQISFTAFDSRGAESVQHVIDVTVVAAPDTNRPPVIDGLTANSLDAGQTIALSSLAPVTWADPDGDAITRVGLFDAIPGTGYIAVNGQPISTTGQVVDVALWASGAVQYVAGSEPGTNQIGLTVFDARGAESAQHFFDVTVEAPTDLDGPTLATATELGALSSQLTASNSVSQTDVYDWYEFSIASERQVGVTMTRSTSPGMLSPVWLVRDSDGDGEFNNGEPVWSATLVDQSTGEQELLVNNLPAGTYHLRVAHNVLPPGEVGYTLSVVDQSSPPPPPPVDTIVGIHSLDDDGLPEGDFLSTIYTFEVDRTGPPTGDLTVGWTVEGIGTHKANGADFVGGVLPFSGNVTIKDGNYRDYIDLIVIEGDRIPEPDETFRVVLSAVPTGTIVDPSHSSAVGIIKNDDRPLVIGNVSGSLFGQAAKLSEDAYWPTIPDQNNPIVQTPGYVPPGWTPLRDADLALADGTLENGVFIADVPPWDLTTVAQVYAGRLEGKVTLALAIRGTDENGELAGQLGNYGNYMQAMQPLLTGVRDVAQNGLPGVGEIEQVLVTGHSLGGSLAERFVAEYIAADSALAAKTTGVTFGSPGGLGNIGDVPFLNVIHNDDIVGNLLFGRADGAILQVEVPEGGPGAGSTEHAMALYAETARGLEVVEVEQFLIQVLAHQGPQVTQIGVEELALLSNAYSFGIGREVYFDDIAVNEADSLSRPDLIFGLSGDDILRGESNLIESNDDWLSGGADNDTLYGGGGNDMLDVGPSASNGKGRQFVDGGDGSNIAIFDGDRSEYAIKYGKGTTEVELTHSRKAFTSYGTTTVVNVQNFQFDDGILSFQELGRDKGKPVKAVASSELTSGSSLDMLVPLTMEA